MKIKINLPKTGRNSPVVNQATANLVPYRFYPYLLDLNSVYSTADSSVILGREKEIQRIFNCFLRTRKKNVVLLGEHGVGKTATLQKLVSKVIQGKCPKELKTYHFLYLDVQNILANMNKKKTSRKLEDIIDFITTYSNLVVVIDQVHLVQADYELSYYFSLLVKTQHVNILGLTTEEEFYDFFEYDLKTRTRLEVIPILEPKLKKVYPMIKKMVEGLEETYGITIKEELVKYIISVSTAFSTELCNPELTLDIVEKSMVYAKRKKQKEVTKQCINQNFNFNYELYNEMSEEDKLITAYHEAGHFVVNFLSENIRNQKTTAITIVPSEDFLGITLFEFEFEKQLSCNREYYVDNIAVDLAGRAAEEICHTQGYTSGAISDLNHATNIARAIITEYGMIKECGENMAFLGNYDYADFSLLSDENKFQINQETKKLIEEAYERARKILQENKPLLDNVAKELLSNEVLDEKDLTRICKEYEQTKYINSFSEMLEKDFEED